MSVKGSGYLPITIYWERPILPEISLHSGEIGTRGYQVRFISATGEVITPAEGQTVTCYAKNLSTKKSYYLEGVKVADYWEVEVPNKAFIDAGIVQVQLALKDGDQALIITDWATVEAQEFLGADGASTEGSGILMDYQKLHEQAEGAAAALDEVKRQAADADKRAQKAEAALARLEENESNRQEAEKLRAESESARSEAEKLRKTAEDLRASAESARADAERAREAQEGGRISRETARVEAESTRTSSEDLRTKAENERKSKETERQAKETERIQAEETRKSQEQARVSSEEKRTSAETLRASAEGQRATKEGERQFKEAERLQAESDRVSQESERQTKESERLRAETSRLSEEKARKTAEDDRVSKEAARQREEASRKSQETTRQDQEAQRQAAEKARKSNEDVRISQETQRVEAERSRKATFAGWDKTMQGVIPNATEEAAGVVKIHHGQDETAPYTAVSLSAFNQGLEGYSNSVGQLISTSLDPIKTQHATDMYTVRSEIETCNQTLYRVQGVLAAKADQGHDHDDRYYTETEIDKKLSGKAEKIHTHQTTEIVGLDQALQAAGKVKSVNGMTGDVTIKEYDDSGLKSRVTALEIKPDKDTVYDDTVLKSRVSAVERTTSGLSSTYLRQDTASTVYATKEDLKKVGSVGYLYMLAATDTTASAADLEALRKYERIEDIIKDNRAIEALAKSMLAISELSRSKSGVSAAIKCDQFMEKIKDEKSIVYNLCMQPCAVEALAENSRALEILGTSRYAVTAETGITVGGYGEPPAKIVPLATKEYAKRIEFRTFTTKNDDQQGPYQIIRCATISEWLLKNKRDPIAISGYMEADKSYGYKGNVVAIYYDFLKE